MNPAENRIHASEQQYLDLLRELLEHGAAKTDRTGTGTHSVFGRRMRFESAADLCATITL